jgi:hypothetical protein
MKRVHDEERGAIAVLFALTIVVLFAAVAFTIDISRLYHERQVLQNAVDFGALAAAQDLPVQGASAATPVSQIARNVAIANAPQIASIGLNIAYRCVVGDRDGDGVADAVDIPYVCGPTATNWSTGWTVRNGRAYHACDPFAGDKCNTIRLSTSNTIPYYFAPVIGINTGSTGAVSASSCKGACGSAMSPVDVVMVLDRTGSMTQADIDNLKNGAMAILGFYDSTQQWVGMVSLPYGQPGNKCQVNSPQNYPDANYADWQVVPLSNNFTLPGGGLNGSSQIVQQINCMQRAGNNVQVRSDGGAPSGNHTNLGDPVDAAQQMLALQGRASVPDVIIFETDGQANQPYGMQPCNYLNTKATAAKAAGITVYTIAYGLDSPPVKCTDTSGFFYNKYATTNLADAATTSTDDLPGGCATTENNDGDSYFCTPGSSDLEPVFRRVAVTALKHSRLVDI